MRTDKAGDALKSLAPIRSLRHALHDCEITLLSSKFNHSLFEYEPQIKNTQLPTNFEDLDASAKNQWIEQNLENFEIAVNLLVDPTIESVELLSLINAKKRFSRWPNSSQIQEVDFNNKNSADRSEAQNVGFLLRKAIRFEGSIDYENDRPVITVDDRKEATLAIGSSPGLRLGICPLAGGTDRLPKMERWKKFIDYMARTRRFASLHLFGSQSESEALRSLMPPVRSAGQPSICMHHPSTFRTLGAYLEQMDAVVGVDSGPLHYARALNVPSLTFMSGGDEVRWFPQKPPRHQVLRRGLFDRFPFAWEMKQSFRHWAHDLQPKITSP